MKGNYLFGAVYILEQDYTDEEMKRDLKYMADAGFNLITLWPAGNPWLAKSATEHVFTQTLRVLDECEKLGMQAIIQLFGQNPSQEFMCDALLTEDMMIHDEEGEHVNYNEYWMNMNHPTVRQIADDYFAQCIAALKDHPAVYGWDAFNEAHFRSDDRYTVSRYQAWLEEQYGDIANLNRHWYRRYACFSQVNPSKRRSTYSVWSSLLPSVEYEYFRSVNVTEICRFLYQTVRKYDTTHPVLIDGTSSQILFDSVIARNNDEFATADVPDGYGGTFYPKSWGRNYKTMPWMAALYFKIPASAARQAGKPYFVNELQTHTQSVITPGSDVEPQELVNWTWMCIFTGAQGMQLWRWRPFLHGYQSTGRGITQPDGTPNARCDGMADVTALLAQCGDFFTSGKLQNKKPTVQIGLSHRARLTYDAFSKWQKNNWPKAVAGWHRAFWNMGLPLEFVDLDRLSEKEKDVPVMVLPSIVSLSDTACRWLEEYVEAGGLLIADGRMNAVDQYAVVPPEGIPGKVLSRVFGLKEQDVFTGGHFVLDGERLEGHFQCQWLAPAEDAEVLATMEDGKPAVIAHRYGKGATLYFNSFVGVLMENSIPASMDALLRSQLAKRHPEQMTVEKSESLHMASLCNGDCEMVLLVNFTEAPAKISFLNVRQSFALVDAKTGESHQITDGTELSVPGGAHVFQKCEIQ